MTELSLSLTRWTRKWGGVRRKGAGAGIEETGRGGKWGKERIGSYQLFARNGQKWEQNDRYKYILESLLDIKLIDCVGV